MYIMALKLMNLASAINPDVITITQVKDHFNTA